MATIKDIANRLGVSVSTISKGLNGASDISEELRQVILDTAVEMGYTTKRSRKEGHKKLCIFIENMDYQSSGQFGYDIVLGFKQRAFRSGWEVDIVPVTPAFQREEKYDTFLLKNGYSGAFLCGFALYDEWMQQLKSTSTPTVLFDNCIFGNPNVCYIGTDSYEGIEQAIAHLYSLGHKNIAFLNGSLHSMITEQRKAAFEAAMRKYNLEIKEELMAHGYFVAETAKYHVPTFLSAGATAIVCGNDLIASGVITECKQRGYRIPEDISVIGFDDIPLAEEISLTTIRQDRNDLGRFAFVMLDSLVAHIAISQTLLRPQLIVRESTVKMISKES